MPSVQFIVDGDSTEKIIHDWGFSTLRFPHLSVLSYEACVDVLNDRDTNESGLSDLQSLCVDDWIIILSENTYQSYLRSRAIDIYLKSSHIGYVVRMYPFWGRIWNDGYGLSYVYRECMNMNGKEMFQEFVRGRSSAETGTTSSYVWYNVPKNDFALTYASSITKVNYNKLEQYLDKCFISVISDRSIKRSYLLDVWKDERYFISSLYHEVAALVLSSRQIQRIGLSSSSMIIDIQSVSINTGDK